MVNATSSATDVTGASGQVTNPGQMDQNAFLKLLVTQLKNQVPMSPMEDKEFIAQLTQFSSLEQLQGINKTLTSFIQGQNSYQAVGMIGHTISATDPDTGKVITGKVESVQFADGQAVLKVGEMQIPLGSVVSVE